MEHKTLSAINNCGHDRLRVHCKGLPNVLCMCSSIDFTFDFGVLAGVAILEKIWSVPGRTAHRDAASNHSQFRAVVCNKVVDCTWNTTMLGKCTSQVINLQSILRLSLKFMDCTVECSLQPQPILVAVPSMLQSWSTTNCLQAHTWRDKYSHPFPPFCVYGSPVWWAPNDCVYIILKHALSQST